MNIYSIPPLVCATFAFFLGIFVYLHNRRAAKNISFALLCLTTFWWQFSWFILFNLRSDYWASYMVKIGYTGIVFIPFTFYHFVISFLGLQREKRKIVLFYILGFVFLLSVWWGKYFLSGYYNYFWGYYPRASFLHPVYLFFLSFCAIRGLIFLLHSMHRENLPASLYNQLRYSFLGFVIYTLSCVDFVTNYGIEIYPLGFIPVIIALTIFAYTILRYRLMDISVALTRSSIFIAIYTLVLGLPFAAAFGFRPWLISTLGAAWGWAAPLILMGLLATGGPFIYIYIGRKAEEKLLREQYRYQQTLKQASAGMTRIRDLNRLLNLIADIVTKPVEISSFGIYLYNQESDKYLLQVSRNKGRMSISKLASDNPLVEWLKAKRDPLVYGEVKRAADDVGSPRLKQLEENMRILSAAVVIPSFLEDRFMGFFVLGEKLSGKIYTPEDLSVFQVLASQAALAIENAQFYVETKQMQEQIAQAEKMATVGVITDGLSHQINNRFSSLALLSADTIDAIKMADTTTCSPEIKDMINDINRALERIRSNVVQGGQVVKGILKYTRKGEKHFEALTLDQVLDGTIEMVQYKIKISEIDLIRNYPKDTPKISGNGVQLQEAFFNFIDNAYDAIVERRTTLKEDGYRGKITVSARPRDGILQVIVSDNGMGVKDDNIKKVFTPFFTTKISARKGTGLGLYVIRRIITDTHKGKIVFESKFKEGTRFILELPVAK